MKQHSTPVIIREEKLECLKKVSLKSSLYNEDWIQNLCFNYPSLLPVTELEPTFGGMIPICRELPTESGYADLLYINEYGFVTIGECKLWKNPEARRKVVGQILDYAKDLSKWDYSKFEAVCLKAGKRKEKTLFEIIQNHYPDIDEISFIDNVQRNLRKGRFLLLIIGDGIQENMEDLVKYIHRNENLHFTLGLIELPVYKNPEKETELVITPRILAKTKEIERIIYQISDMPIEKISQEEYGTERSQTISEKVYFERLEQNIGIEKTKELQQLITTISSQLNIATSLGRSKTRSISLKSSNGYNLITIFETGEVYFYGIWTGVDKDLYLKKIANIANGRISKEAKWAMAIKKENDQLFNVVDFLNIKEKWIDVVTETMDEIYRSEEND